MDRKEMQNTRLYLLAAFLVLALVAYLFVLYDAQVIHYDDYATQAIRSIVRTEKVESSRGIITDRNGKPLVSNRSTYDLTFDSALLSGEDDSNEAILRLVQLCIQQGVTWNDNLPITRQPPYRYTVDEMDAQQRGRFLNYLKKSNSSIRQALGQFLLRHPDRLSSPEEEDSPADSAALSVEARADAMVDRLTTADLTTDLLVEAGVTPAQLMDAMRRQLNVPEDYTLTETRLVLGVQYELSLRKLDNYDAYVLAEDIDVPFISILSDGNYAGAKVTLSSVREYETTYAAHILGYVNKIGSPEEYRALKDKGYDYDDLVGKEGVELAFEDYLKGKDGLRIVATNDEGKVTGEYYKTEPVPGNTVELTIDLNFQAQVEDVLAQTVERLNADGDESRGAGAAVIQVGTGEVLALASYPSYDLATFRQTAANYAALDADPHNPMYNRAVQGGYPPGSTLKPFTAMAALLHGDVTLTEKIKDTGRWTYPGDEANSYSNCWKRSGHGYLNVTGAITNSCNYFFSELGYRMGMDTLREYLLMFGLGEKTGIEIPEYAGRLPENPQGQDQAPWAAYGQSSQLYSPLQLANYVATLVSGGKHCQAHLLKAAKAYDNSAVVAVGSTDPVNTIDISDDYLNAVKQGMKGLVEGTLAPYFRNCVVTAGAKTGTSQVRADTKNHGVFICFAPYDEPEIAVAIAIERADAGAALASTAVSILNAYFTPAEDTASATGENQLLP